jgi:hypothetical protein
MDKTPEDHWRELSEQILTDITEWRRSHPKATLREIEDARPQEDESIGSTTDPGYGPAEYESSLERSGLARATHLSSVWHALTCTRQASP